MSRRLSIAMLLLGVVVLPLVSAFALSIGNTAESNQRSSNSSDAQLFSSYFSTDVASADDVSVSNPLSSSTNAPSACGYSGPVIIQFHATGPGVANRYVAYVIANNATATALMQVPVYQVNRLYCEGNSGNGPALSTTVVAQSVTSNVIKAQCGGADCPVAQAPAAISSTPLQIALNAITEFGRKSTDPTFQFSVAGTRRVTP